ncbi:hypothetical protein [Coxiella burnetii]|uniref:hypothetical protein n=1 Tax=Coxiella burnetii TaxID=777 RepID=UPI000A8D59B4|nr:hypothetical protein [Coxiella burnetii]
MDKELADKFAERDNLPFLRSSSAIEKDIDDGYECGWDSMRDETTITIKLISVSDEMAEYFNEHQRESLMKFNKYACFSRLYSIATDIADSQEKIINHYPIFPLEGLYEAGLYSDEHRGRINRDQPQENVTSPYLGILRSIHPVPFYDKVMVLSRPPQKDRCPEHSTFDPKASFPKHLFELNVHPFVKSISGMIFVQIRTILGICGRIRQLKASPPTGKRFLEIIQYFVFNSIYFMGGHSLYEFIAPFHIRVFVEELQEAGLHELTYLTIDKLLEGHQESLAEALKCAIHYNRVFINKQKLHEEISKRELEEKLKTYRKNRVSNSREYFFVKWGVSKTDKINAVDKVLNFLKGEKVTFFKKDRRALHNKTLGKIIEDEKYSAFIPSEIRKS